MQKEIKIIKFLQYLVYQQKNVYKMRANAEENYDRQVLTIFCSSIIKCASRTKVKQLGNA